MDENRKKESTRLDDTSKEGRDGTVTDYLTNDIFRQYGQVSDDRDWSTQDITVVSWTTTITGELPGPSNICLFRYK